MIRTTRTTTRGAAALLGTALLLLLPGCGGGTAAQDPVVAAPSSASTGPAPAPSGRAEDDAREGTVSEVAVTVAGGQVQGPGDRVEVPLGSTVRLTVTSDAADEAHVHGYDHTLALAPGEPATVEFLADIPGVFEVELHESGLPLTSLQVQ